METIQKRLLSRKEACAYVGLGLNRGVEFCDQSGARIQYGDRVLYDRKKLDEYIDEEVARQNASNSEV